MVMIKLKGTPWNTNGVLPKKGEIAPAFCGLDMDLKERKLDEFKGEKKIICFVPSLDTPVCHLSAEKFNQLVRKKENTVVLYASFDLPFALKRVCLSKDGDLKHIILVSLFRSKKTAEDYGVLVQDGPLAGLCARAVIALDENDHVIYAELVEELSHEPNYDQVLALV